MKKTEQSLTGNLNHFAQIKFDADCLLEMAQAATDHSKITFSRTAILTYIISLEILINRVIEEFWPKELPRTFYADVKRWPTPKKWEEVPKIFRNAKIEKGRGPIQLIKALFEVRNDIVHAQDNTFQVKMNAYKTNEGWEIHMPPNPEKYPMLNLIKDPCNWLPSDASNIKRIVQELITWLDGHFSGDLTKTDWIISDFYEDKYGFKIAIIRNYMNDK